MAKPTPAAPRPLRVLQLCSVESTARDHVLPLAQHLRRHGVDVRVACRKGESAAAEAAGVPVAELPLPRGANPLSQARSLASVTAWLAANRVDVVHVHSPGVAGAGRIAAALARVPVVVHTAHGLRFEATGGGVGAMACRLAERAQSRLQDYLLCHLREDARTAERLRLCPSSRVFDIRHGVDPGRFDPERLGRHRAAVREGLGISASAPVVVFVGRPLRRRGVLDLAEAARVLCARHPDARLLVVGGCRPGDPTDARDLLQAMAAEPGELAGRCLVLGRREDVPDLLAASDIFCLPTQDPAVPTALVEAMMMQLPVVATRVRGCRDVVIDGQTGFLVEPRTPRDLAGALCYLVEHPDVASKMGGAGRRQALEAHDLKETLASQWTVYERLIARRGGA